jgi:FtsH-binding integral membrane protein
MSYQEQAYPRQTTYGQEAVDSRAVFGQVMGLVAVTSAFAAGGAYLGRDITGGAIWIAFIGAFGCLIGLNFAARRNEQLAIALLFGAGLLLGVAVAPAIAFYADRDPAALWQATGATALFIGALGAYGYGTSRDLSRWARPLLFALMGLIAFGFVGLFLAIPGGNIIYCVAGLAVFGFFTVFDFWRLRRAGMNQSVQIAASIFLDVFNVFLFFLSIFGGGRR